LVVTSSFAFGTFLLVNQYAQQQQWANQQADNYANHRANYDRAFGACMEGRGYTVK